MHTKIHLNVILVILVVLCGTMIDSGMAILQPEWVNRAGGISYDTGVPIAVVSHEGEVILLGSLSSDNATFSSQGVIEDIHSADLFNMSDTVSHRGTFLAKYNTSGSLEWAQHFGHLPGTDPFIALDPIDGSITVVGTFFGSFTFGKGSPRERYIDNHRSTIFLAKYSYTGEFLWVSVSSPYNYNFVKGITINPVDRSIAVTGQYADQNYYDPRHIFVSKYDPNGDLQWTRSAEGGRNYPYSVAVDASDGSIVITGNILNNITFAKDTLNEQQLLSDLFVAKYDSNGMFLWAQGISCTIPDYCYARFVAVNSIDSSIVVSGDFRGDVLFGVGTPQQRTLYSSWSSSYMVKYNHLGTVQWARDVDESSAFSVAFDISGNVIVSGRGSQPYIAKYNPTGTLVWKHSYGDYNFYPTSMALGNNGNKAIIGGRGYGFSTPSGYISSAGDNDIFLIQLNINDDPITCPEGMVLDGSHTKCVSICPYANFFRSPDDDTVEFGAPAPTFKAYIETNQVVIDVTLPHAANVTHVVELLNSTTAQQSIRSCDELSTIKTNQFQAIVAMHDSCTTTYRYVSDLNTFISHPGVTTTLDNGGDFFTLSTTIYAAYADHREGIASKTDTCMLTQYDVEWSIISYLRADSFVMFDSNRAQIARLSQESMYLLPDGRLQIHTLLTMLLPGNLTHFSFVRNNDTIIPSRFLLKSSTPWDTDSFKLVFISESALSDYSGMYTFSADYSYEGATSHISVADIQLSYVVPFPPPNATQSYTPTVSLYSDGFEQLKSAFKANERVSVLNELDTKKTAMPSGVALGIKNAYLCCTRDRLPMPMYNPSNGDYGCTVDPSADHPVVTHWAQLISNGIASAPEYESALQSFPLDNYRSGFSMGLLPLNGENRLCFLHLQSIFEEKQTKRSSISSNDVKDENGAQVMMTIQDSFSGFTLNSIPMENGDDGDGEDRKTDDGNTETSAALATIDHKSSTVIMLLVSILALFAV